MTEQLKKDKAEETELDAKTAELKHKVESATEGASKLAGDEHALEQDDKHESSQLSALVAAVKQGIANLTAVQKPSLLETGVEPVMDKTADVVPEQGFEGPAVAHVNMETTTSDWSKEYEIKVPKKAAAALLGLALVF